MCLYIQTKNNNPEYDKTFELIKAKKRYKDAVMKFSKTAGKDIPVFKVLSNYHNDNSMYSPFNSMAYKYGTIYKARFRFTYAYLTQNNGTYINNETQNNNFSKKTISITAGLHSFENLIDAVSLKNRLTSNCYSVYNASYSVYNAVIPKGSMYFIGIDGDIVSNRLMIINKNS